MSQKYTIKSVKMGNQFINSHNKPMQGYSLVLEGVSEPVVLNKMVPVNHEPEEGDELFGNITQEKSIKGTEYNKFTIDYSEPLPEASGAPTSAPAASSGWKESPEKKASINRAVALNNAVLFAGAEAKGDYSIALEYADQFYAWLSQTTIEEDIKNVNLDELDY